MYIFAVICSALPNTHTTTYHIHNTIEYYLPFLYFLIKQETLQGIEPETSTLIGQVYQTS